MQQLQERDQLLCAQNEMLKVCQKTYCDLSFPNNSKSYCNGFLQMDKTNLLRKVAELDDAVRTLVGTRNTHPAPQSSKTKACLHT